MKSAIGQRFLKLLEVTYCSADGSHSSLFHRRFGKLNNYEII